MAQPTDAASLGSRRRVWIDGDACPVVAEVIEIARRHGVAVTLVANPSQGLRRGADIEVVIVRSGPDEADDRIVSGCAASDVCVTADIELAARVLQKGGHAFSPRGDRFTPERMPSLLAARAIAAHRRDQGEYGGGPPAFGAQARGLFKRNFHQFLERLVAGKPLGA